MELKSLPKSDESKTTTKTASPPLQDSTWVWDTFKKRECIKYIPTVRSNKEKITRCGCGMDLSGHQFLTEKEQRSANGSVKYVDETIKTTVTARYTGMGNGSAQIRTTSSSSNMMKVPSLVGLKSLPIYKPPVQAKEGLKWNSLEHTKHFPTDAYGTLEFQGTGEGDKSQYLRFAHDTCPASVLNLLIKEWNLKSPNLVITVHGGSQNFQLQPKIRRAFCDGLIKAAETTGAWVMSYGLDRGIGRIVGKALREHKQQSRSKICSIGVAPWGMVDHRENLIGNESIKAYQTMSNPVSKGAVLNTAYSNFLFVDNGSVGRCDCEIQFRRLLEERLSQLQTVPDDIAKFRQQQQRLNGIEPDTGRGSLSMVCVVLEGGKNVINVVQKCVQQTPPIPVIVCDGSGRAADLLAFAHQHADEDGDFQDDDVRQQFLSLVEDSFKCTHEQANFYLTTITDCVKRKDLVTVFRLGQGQDDMDRTILTISLKARCKSAPEMLKLAQSWDRADIAASQIFVYGQKWPVMSLENAMMDALVADQVNFVKLLMDHGVSMHKFLTIGRLECLYNSIKLPLNIKHLLKDVKTVRNECGNSLIDIGYVIESLMGGGYKSTYTKKSFRSPYTKVRAASKAMKAKTGQNYSNQMFRDARHDLHPTLLADMGMKNQATYDLDLFNSKHFSYPFHELLVWAVLFQRQKMALFMWQHGEEALAKSLVAYRLYKVMADEAADDDLDGVEFRHLEHYATDFEGIAVKLLDVCYRADENETKKLLTYELNEWSKQTCLNLAVGAKHRDFIAHPCCQLLLNDLWHGPLAFRKFSVPKLIVGMFCPFYICTLQFKTQNELQYVGHSNHFNIDSTSSPSWSSLSESSDRTSSSSYGELVVSKRLKCPASRAVEAVPTMRTEIPKYSKFSLRLLLDFWKAPVTKFYSFIISYLLILLNFDTLVLRKQDGWSPMQEYTMMAYVVAAVCDMIHEVMISEASSFAKKLKISLWNPWKMIEIIKYVLFVVGFYLRFGHTEHLQETRLLLYYLSACLWNMYLLAILGKTKTFGPTVTLMGKMISDLLIVCCVLFVFIIAFGVTRTAITKPGRDLSTDTIKDVLMEPYFMLYGEVYADIIDPCDHPEKGLCNYGSFLLPVMECIFLLAACLIGLNALIARFNSTYQYLRPHSDKIWMFGRYHIIWQLARQPALPIPLSLFSYLFQFISYSCCRRPRRNYGLKLYLDNLSVEKLHDFEEESVDDFFRNRKLLPECLIVEQNNPSIEETVRMINDKMEETVEQRLLHERNMIDIADRYDWLCRYSCEFIDYIRRQELRQNDSSREFSAGVGGGGNFNRENSDDEFSNHHMPMRISNGVIARRRMRIRQDSEMSTTSGWMHPPYGRSRSYQERMNPTINRPATQMCHSTTLTKIRSTGALENLQDNYSTHGRRHPRLLRQSSLDAGSSGNLEKDQRRSLSCFNLLQQTDSSGSSDVTRSKKRKLDEDDESFEGGSLIARNKRLSRSLTFNRRSCNGDDEHDVDDGQLSWKSFPDKFTAENSLECIDDEPPFYSETNASDVDTPPPNITQFEMDSDCYHDEGGDLPPPGRLTSRPPRPMRKASTNYSSITDQIVIRQPYESLTDVPVFENTPVMNFGRVRCARRQKLNINNETTSTSMKPTTQAFEKRLRYRNRTKKSKVKSFDNPNQTTNSSTTTTTTAPTAAAAANSINGDRKKAQKKYQFSAFRIKSGVKWKSSNAASGGSAGSRAGAESVFRSQDDSQTPSPE